MLEALLRALMRLLERLSKQENSGSGAIQVSRVAGSVTIHQYQPAPEEPEPDPDPVDAPTVGELIRMYKRLEPWQLNKLHEFMQDKFGTTTIKDLTPGERGRLNGYLLRCMKTLGLTRW